MIKAPLTLYLRRYFDPYAESEDEEYNWLGYTSLENLREYRRSTVRTIEGNYAVDFREGVKQLLDEVLTQRGIELSRDADLFLTANVCLKRNDENNQIRLIHTPNLSKYEKYYQRYLADPVDLLQHAPLADQKRVLYICDEWLDKLGLPKTQDLYVSFEDLPNPETK